MWRFTELADWFEGKRAQSDKILVQWVESSDYSQNIAKVEIAEAALIVFLLKSVANDEAQSAGWGLVRAYSTSELGR